MMLLDATKQGRIFMVQYLLDSGNVNVNETDKQGQTALIKACLLDDNMAATRRKLIRILLSKGACVGNVDVLGRNVLMWACFLGKVDVAEILVGRCLMDLDFNCVDLHGNTALHYVASAGHFSLITMLVGAMNRFGVSVDKRNNQGITPLLEAIKHGKEQCARVLLNNGASPHTVDPETLMNTKQLADSRHLKELTELISITSPSTQSRCTIFSSEPDGNDVDASSGSHLLNLRSPSAKSTRSSVNNSPENVFEVCGDFVTPDMPRKPVRNSPSATSLRTERKKATLHGLVRKRGETLSVMSSKERQRRLLETSEEDKNNSSLKLTKKNGFEDSSVSVTSKTTSCRSLAFPDQCTTIRSVSRQREVSCISQDKPATLKNPYDLRELKDLLSLHGEQKSSSFRVGFSTPTMTPEQFQECLRVMEPVLPDDPHSSRRSSNSTTSSATGLGTQTRRPSLLLKDAKSGISNSSLLRRRRSSVRSYTCVKDLARIVGRNRNFSDPTIKFHEPGSPKSTRRRHSLMCSTQLQYLNMKYR